MVEVEMDQAFPYAIHFENEKGALVMPEAQYEWKLVTYVNCHGLGHNVSQCHQEKKQAKKVRVVKKQHIPGEEGFQLTIHNSFEVLKQDSEKLEKGCHDTTNEGIVTVESIKDESDQEGLLISMDNILSWNVKGLNRRSKQP